MSKLNMWDKIEDGLLWFFDLFRSKKSKEREALEQALADDAWDEREHYFGKQHEDKGWDDLTLRCFGYLKSCTPTLENQPVHHKPTVKVCLLVAVTDLNRRLKLIEEKGNAATNESARDS